MDAALKPFLRDFDMRRDPLIGSPATPEPMAAEVIPAFEREREGYIARRKLELARAWRKSPEHLAEAHQQTPVIPAYVWSSLAVGLRAQTCDLLLSALEPALLAMADKVAEEEAFARWPEAAP
jgi:hypothetical protein